VAVLKGRKLKGAKKRGFNNPLTYRWFFFSR